MKTNVVKKVLQYGVLGFIVFLFLKPFFGGAAADTEAYCPFGGLQTLFTFLQQDSLACSMSMVQILVGVALGIGVILSGKLFCAYICPLGTINELMGKLRKKLKIKLEIKEKSIFDMILRSLKYVMLGWIFYMTISSSELFCKNFDPYYALATGFKGEITLWMVSITLGLFFVCGILINMFWCKYICPVGALSNVFKYTATFAVVLIAFILLNKFGIALSYVWMFVIAGAICYVWEIMSYESRWLPFLKIHRDTEKCNGCGVCSKKCPMNIAVDEMAVVKHVDCTLCGDCIDACGKQQALSINKKTGFRFVPAIMTVVLFALALFLGNRVELPTIDERFPGYEEKFEAGQIEMLEIEGLKTVKCYGSSKAFSAKMQNVKGVYGVATYIQRFAVKIYYNPNEISEVDLQSVVFSPVRRRLNDVPAGEAQVKVVTLGVEGLFDAGDVNVLGNIFKENPDFYGIQSEYACPVIIKLFMKADKTVTKKELTKIVEIKEFDMVIHGGAIRKVECNYELVTVDKNETLMPRQEFFDLMFPYQEGVSKKNTEKYGEDAVTAVYEIPFLELEKPLYQRQVRFLASHLTGQDGIMRWNTTLNGEIPVIHFHYIPDVLDDEKIWTLITAPMWKIYWPDGRIEEVEPTMTFDEKGKTIQNETN
ncbi:MAG: 4Fe-4S binding protein [Bacteroidales bacterium]|jgi:polyferredoxin|nr:4Fe-4S binding protein [Bacteroidales bacterium]